MSLGIMELENNSEVKEAYDFFSALKEGLKSSVSATCGQFTGINEYGKVDCVKLYNDAAKSAADGSDLNSVMDSLGNILIATIYAKSGGDAEKMVDPQYWKQGFNALSSLFCSSTSVSTITYSDKKVSQDIITEVMKIAFDVNGMAEGKLKSDITSWLQEQAGLMEQLTFNDAHLADPYSIFDFVNFVKDGVHTCGFRAYFTEFNTDTVKISRSCRSPEKKFDFNLKVTCYTSGFMLSAWENDEAFRKRVTDFIASHPPVEDFFNELSTKGEFSVLD